MKNIKQIIKEELDEFVHAAIGKDDWVTIYRVGEITHDKNGWGFFFAFDKEYFDYTDTGYKFKNAKKYLLNMNTKIWNPIEELNLDVETWSKIIGSSDIFEEYGIVDECDYDIEEGFAVTSTDGLASAGKALGYQAVLIRNVPQTQRPYKSTEDYGFDEICIFDTSIIKKVEN